MADSLASAGAGHNLGRASFLDFCTEHSKVDRELAEVAETRRSLNRRRKDLRKNMAAAGIDIAMFDRVLDDLELTPEELAAQATEYRRYMEWRDKPPGFQPSMDLQTEDPALRALNVHELHAIDGEGFDAGQAGRRRDSNPYQPGTEGHQRWDNAWYRGQKVAVEELGAGAATGAAANGAENESAPTKRRPGRPRKAAASDPAANGNGHEPEPAEPPPGQEGPPTEPPPPVEPPPPPEPPNPGVAAQVH